MNPAGSPIDASNYRRDLKRVARKAGLGELRTHDLRHTYATHLTVAIYKGGLRGYVKADDVDAYTVSSVESAVPMAMLSLGHASETSTRLYVQHAPKFLHIPLEVFFGAPQ
ncbi:MAG: tyrosine-type recombinase/integrase [Planctomycetota bacterium]